MSDTENVLTEPVEETQDAAKDETIEVAEPQIEKLHAEETEGSVKEDA